jgi:hypothetical protein
VEQREYEVDTSVMIFIIFEFNHFSHKTAVSGDRDDWLLDLDLITVIQQYNTIRQGLITLQSHRGVLGRIEHKSRADCFWDITEHFFIVIVTLYNRRFSGLVSKRFSKLLFLFGLYMSLAIFCGEELSNCKLLTVYSTLWGSCHDDDGYEVQECKLAAHTKGEQQGTCGKNVLSAFTITDIY